MHTAGLADAIIAWADRKPCEWVQPEGSPSTGERIRHKLTGRLGYVVGHSASGFYPIWDDSVTSYNPTGFNVFDHSRSLDNIETWSDQILVFDMQPGFEIEIGDMVIQTNVIVFIPGDNPRLVLTSGVVKKFKTNVDAYLAARSLAAYGKFSPFDGGYQTPGEVYGRLRD
jgi:hypothetical protein